MVLIIDKNDRITSLVFSFVYKYSIVISFFPTSLYLCFW
jgi:hypothetical protein